ncbi:MAG TPA: hypothetical protein VFR20_05375 [Burkholderiaceae bacterium]|nr:hypothetical protein [Burkholderiaceae bacterium]
MAAVPCPELPVSPIAASTLHEKNSWRKWWRTLFAASPRTNDKEWRNALPMLLNMDSRLLKDIGAPAWVISEAIYRQRQSANTIEDVLLVRHGRAGARRF